MAKVSIVIPIYNVAEYIEKCLESVVNQTLRDIEIILVNDGTKDNSMQLCERFINNDARIKVINKENGGLMSAWIAGVQVASSDYIGFVDSDDWIDPQYFEQLYTHIVNQDADMVVGQFVYECEHPYVLKRTASKIYTGSSEIMRLADAYLKGFSLDEQSITYCRWDKLYKRQIIVNNLPFFNQGVSLGEDINTNTAVIPDCGKIVVLNDTAKYHYRINPASISNTYREDTINNILKLHHALSFIASQKHLSQESVDACIGNMVFVELSKVALMKKMRLAEKYRITRTILNKCPTGTLDSYSRARHSILVSFYCKLLNCRLIISCILLKVIVRRFKEIVAK